MRINTLITCISQITSPGSIARFSIHPSVYFPSFSRLALVIQKGIHNIKKKYDEKSFKIIALRTHLPQKRSSHFIRSPNCFTVYSPSFSRLSPIVKVIGFLAFLRIAMSTAKAETKEMDPLASDMDQLEKIAKVLGMHLPERLSNETMVFWYKRCKQACFEGILKACLNQEWERIQQMDLPFLNRLSDQKGRPLFLACVESGADKSCLQYLIDSLFLDFYGTDLQGNHALHAAVKYKRADLISFLAGKFLDERNKNNETALHLAILRGDANMVIQLIAEGLNKNASLERLGITVTPFSLAVMEGQNECIHALANLKDPHLIGMKDPVVSVGNILHLAIQFDRLQTLKYLLQDYYSLNCALIEGKDPKGRTPLALAAFLGDEKVVHFLCKEKEANVHVKDHEGNTPLHLAVLGRRPNMIIRLISLGAKTDALNGQAQTPLELINQLLRDSNEGVREKQTKVSLIQGMQKQEFLRSRPLDFLREPPENLVFQGGGPKGVAYVGALEALQEKELLNQVRRVAGTSAGAITATLLAVGYSPRELKEILMNFDLGTFLDPAPGNERFLKATLSAADAYKTSEDPLAAIKYAFKNDPGLLFRPDELHRLLKSSPGLCKGNAFREWMEDKIATKVAQITGKEKKECQNLTFGELKKLFDKGKRVKHLYMFATRLQSDEETQTQEFNSEDEACHDFIISDATRCSMSIPGVFAPAQIYVKREGKRLCLGNDFYLDGGLLRNFPLGVFDSLRYQSSGASEEEKKWKFPNRQTLGLALAGQQNGKKGTEEIRGTIDLILAIANLAWTSEDFSKENGRVIAIPFQGIGLLDFNLTPKQKEYLVNCGNQAVDKEFVHSAALRNQTLNTSKGLLESNIEIFYDHHIRRKTKLAELAKNTFEQSNTPIIRLLWGLGGMGKSELARDFAHLYGQDFSITWEFNCEDAVYLEESYRSFAKAHKIPNGNDFASLQRNVHRFLETKAKETNKPWLLIFDNIEEKIDPKKMFPRGFGTVLATSRKKEIWENAEDKIHVGQFSLEESIQLIESITGEQRTREMEKLAQSLENFPVAISKAAHLIEESNCGIKKFLEIYQPEKDPLGFNATTKYKYALKEVWRITLDHLKKDMPDAIEWLNMCVYFNPIEIPFDWLENWEKIKHPEKDAAKESNEIAKVLRNYDLIRGSKGNTTFSMHRLIQEAIKNNKSDPQTTFIETFHFLKKRTKSSSWARHFSRLFDLQYQEWMNAIPEQERLQTLKELAHYTLYESKDYKLGIDFCHLGLKMSQKMSHLQEERVFSLNLVEGYYMVQNLKEAEKYSIDSLNLSRKFFQENSLEIAEARKDLQAIQFQMAKERKNPVKIKETIKEMEEILTIFNEINQKTSEPALSCLINMGVAYSSLAEMEENPIERKRLIEKGRLKSIEALQMIEDKLQQGQLDQTTLMKLQAEQVIVQNNISYDLIESEKYQEALAYLKKAYQTEKRNNPDSLYIRHLKTNLGKTYQGLSRSAHTKEEKVAYLEKAKKRHQEALTILSQQLSEDSLDAANCRLSLGKIHEDLNQLPIALQEFNLCYQIRKQHYEPEDKEIKEILAAINRIEKKQKPTKNWWDLFG